MFFARSTKRIVAAAGATVSLRQSATRIGLLLCFAYLPGLYLRISGIRLSIFGRTVNHLQRRRSIENHRVESRQALAHVQLFHGRVEECRVRNFYKTVARVERHEVRHALAYTVFNLCAAVRQRQRRHSRSDESPAAYEPHPLGNIQLLQVRN